MYKHDNCHLKESEHIKFFYNVKLISTKVISRRLKRHTAIISRHLNFRKCGLSKDRNNVTSLSFLLFSRNFLLSFCFLPTKTQMLVVITTV